MSVDSVQEIGRVMLLPPSVSGCGEDCRDHLGGFVVPVLDSYHFVLQVNGLSLVVMSHCGLAGFSSRVGPP